MAAPTPQKSRPIGFVLDRSKELSPGNPLLVHQLAIRPSDLSRTEPSRVAVQQTMGSAFVDHFGTGLGNITIAGNTGWLPKPPAYRDWLAEFQSLRDCVYVQWHQWRALALSRGKDQDLVKLIFIDTVDDIVSVVVPTAFSLRRSKSQPLLISYSISLSVVAPRAADSYVADLEKLPRGAVQFALGIETLEDVAASIDQMANDAASWIDATLLSPAKKFLELSAQILAYVNRIDRAIDTLFAPVIALGRTLAQAGTNAFRSLAGVAGLPSRIRARYMDVAGTYATLYCVLSNVMGIGQTLPNYLDVYGASNCSSTSGGLPLSPLRAENPFYPLTTPVNAPVIVSQNATARDSSTLLARHDPVQNPMSPDEIGAHLGAVVAGTAVRTHPG